jgi:hypothetical protein
MIMAKQLCFTHFTMNGHQRGFDILYTENGACFLATLDKMDRGPVIGQRIVSDVGIFIFEGQHLIMD